MALYEPFLTGFVSSLHGNPSPVRASVGGVKADAEHSLTWDIASILSGWDRTFDKLLKSIEDKVAQDRKSRLKGSGGGTLAQCVPASEPPSKDVGPGHDPDEISRNVQALKNRFKSGAAGPRGGRRRSAKSNRVQDSPSNTEYAPFTSAARFVALISLTVKAPTPLSRRRNPRKLCEPGMILRP